MIPSKEMLSQSSDFKEIILSTILISRNWSFPEAIKKKKQPADIFILIIKTIADF